MRVKNVFAFVSAFCVFFLTSSFLNAESASQGSPSVYFPADQYEFDLVLEDDYVRHDLVVKNKGNAPLEIKDVGTA